MTMTTPMWKNSVEGMDSLNYEGVPTYERSERERILQTLMVGVWGDTFYASKRELDKQALNTLLQARQTDPEFLAKALVYARSKGLMKDANTRGIAVLAGGGWKTRKPFEAAFNQVIGIPDDLRNFSELLLLGQIPGKRGLGGYAAKAVAGWLSTMSEFHAIKYGSSASKGVTLRDIIRMTHPVPANAAVAERLGWLVTGKLGSNPRLNPQIRAYVALKSAKTEDEVVALVAQGQLPFEVVVPAVKQMTPRIWEQLFHNAPYLNLLRNLVTFTRHGVFSNKDNVAEAVERLTRTKAVERSKVLPFRFFDAWRQYVSTDGYDSAIADALRVALNLSFASMPSFGNATVAIGTDVSGSMSTVPISNKGRTMCIDIAGIFTGALLRKIEGRAIPIPFEARVIGSHGLSVRDDVLVTAEKIKALGGGGTALGSPIEYLMRHKTHADVFVGLTDNEDWAYGSSYYTSGSFLTLWREYRAKLNPNAQAFVVQLAPYSHAVAPAGEAGVHFIYGWSDAVIKYIPYMLEGGASQLREVSRMDLYRKDDPAAEDGLQAQNDEGEF